MLGVRGHEHDVPDERLDGLPHLEAIEVWHPDVEKHHVRPQAAHRRRHLARVGAFADDVEVGRLVQQLTQPLTRQGFVIDEKNGMPTSDHVVS
jgi:hypothetical protein